jgi:tripartite-type tricarboxylate transporter receptor subunit TctC
MDNRFRRAATRALVAGVSIIAISQQPAHAQEYPSKPITFVVPYAAGGNADLRSRQVAQKLSIILHTPVIVDNKPGAGGNIGTAFIARAAPDGYVIGMGNFAPLAVNQALFKKLPYDPQKDLLPVVLVEKGPLVLMVNPKSPYKTVQDIVAAAKAKPGVLTFASGGIGGSHQLSAELFKQTAGIDMIHVPYKGGAPAATDLMAGNVDMMFEQMYAAMPSIQAGKLRPLAVTSKARLPALPNVPTFAEAGLPQVEVLNWQGVIAPKGTSPAIIAKLNQAVNQGLQEANMRDIIIGQGNEVGGGTPQEFAALIAAESVKWGHVVREAKIKPE